MQFPDKLSMPVIVASGADGETVEYTRGDSTGAVLGQVVHARCCVWCRWPDSADNCGDSTDVEAGCGGVSGSWTPDVPPLVHSLQTAA